MKRNRAIKVAICLALGMATSVVLASTKTGIFEIVNKNKALSDPTINTSIFMDVQMPDNRFSAFNGLPMISDDGINNQTNLPLNQVRPKGVKYPTVAGEYTGNSVLFFFVENPAYGPTGKGSFCDFIFDPANAIAPGSPDALYGSVDSAKDGMPQKCPGMGPYQQIHVSPSHPVGNGYFKITETDGAGGALYTISTCDQADSSQCQV